LNQILQKTRTRIVDGIATAQYIQDRDFMMCRVAEASSRKGALRRVTKGRLPTKGGRLRTCHKRTAKNVPGRKTIVRTAIPFIADESSLLSRAISRLCSDIRRFVLLPAFAIWTSSCIHWATLTRWDLRRALTHCL
jgi:hypothetical protein